MMSIEEMHEILNTLADELPQEFFKELNGGISLLPDVKYSPYARNRDLFILAQYHRGGAMGRFITIYYGSFMEVYPRFDTQALTAELRRVLRHEFRHHMESLAGNHDLEVEDKEFIEGYLEQQRVEDERV